MLPATAKCFIQLYYGDQFITNSVTQTNLCIKITTLGIQNIRLGPTLPAFLSPGVVRVLQEKYNLMAVTTPEQDLKAILGEG